MSPCSRCKKMFEEIFLTWAQVNGKIKLYCNECISKTKKSRQELGL